MKRFLFSFVILCFSFDAFAHVNWKDCRMEYKNADIQLEGVWQKCLNKIAENDNARSLLSKEFFDPMTGVFFMEKLKPDERTITNDDNKVYDFNVSGTPKYVDFKFDQKQLIISRIVNVMSKFCSDEFYEIMREGYTSSDNDKQNNIVRLAYLYKNQKVDVTDNECVVFEFKKSDAIKSYPHEIGIFASNKKIEKGTILKPNHLDSDFWDYRCSDHNVATIEDSVISDAAREVFGTSPNGIANGDYYIDIVGEDPHKSTVITRLFPGLLMVKWNGGEGRVDFALTFHNISYNIPSYETALKALKDFSKKITTIRGNDYNPCLPDEYNGKPMQLYLVAINSNKVSPLYNKRTLSYRIPSYETINQGEAVNVRSGKLQNLTVISAPYVIRK